MAYTNNVPQGNQQIASTQAPILANFAFLPTSIGTEHNFNAAGSGNDTYHLKASMPNMADPVALPAGTNGMFYVNGGVPKFYNGAVSFIQLVTVTQNTLSGTAALNNGGFSNVVTIPANSCGMYFLLPPLAVGTNAYAMGQFITTTTSLVIGAVSDPDISLQASSRTLQARTASAGENGNYKYLVVYYTP